MIFFMCSAYVPCRTRIECNWLILLEKEVVQFGDSPLARCRLNSLITPGCNCNSFTKVGVCRFFGPNKVGTLVRLRFIVWSFLVLEMNSKLISLSFYIRAIQAFNGSISKRSIYYTIPAGPSLIRSVLKFFMFYL